MIAIDVSVLLVIVLSVAFAIMRGFVKESISLATWIAAFLISTQFAPRLAVLLPDALEGEFIRQGFALIALFFATMIAGGLINFIISKLVETTGLSSTDRALGAVFGVFRGIVIVCALVVLGIMLDQPRTEWWQSSRVLLLFQELTVWCLAIAPDDLLARMGIENL